VVADVLVVGASVAGAATATHLARLGHSVDLIDKATFPRRKPCGEGLFSPGVAELERLGILPSLFSQAQVLSGLRLTFRGHTIDAPIGDLSRPVIGVERRILDSLLLEAARESGVNIRLGVTALGLIEGGGRFTGVDTDQGILTTRVIVVADGAQSRLRRQAGLGKAATRRGRYGVSGHFEVPEPPAPRVGVHIQDGYEVYVTPVRGRLVNVAILSGRDRARSLSGNLTTAYREMAEESGALPAGSVLADAPLAAGPFPAEAGRVWKSNLVLVGDAAGFFDGVTGDGMSLALVSAQMCAGAVREFLATGESASFAVYARKRRALVRNPQLLGRLLLTLATHPRIGARVASNLARRPETFAKLMRINQGEHGFSSLRPRDLLAALAGI